MLNYKYYLRANGRRTKEYDNFGELHLFVLEHFVEYCKNKISTIEDIKKVSDAYKKLLYFDPRENTTEEFNNIVSKIFQVEDASYWDDRKFHFDAEVARKADRYREKLREYAENFRK